MPVEIADAYVALYTQMPGVQKDISNALSSSNVQTAVAGSGRTIGGSFVSGLGAIVKGGAIAVGTVAAAGLGTALTKGFSRLRSIDDATAKLEGLGHEAGSVDQIMKNALASVRGTAYGMDAAATVAASTVAAGVAPGQDLERTLKLVADAATIAGTDMSSMGSIFNKVATSNKIQGDTIAQLSDSGIPVVQFLAKQLGITGEEVVALASKGEISFAQFQDAMQAGLGGAALSSGTTFSGALDNVFASLSRIGAGLLGGIFPKIAPLFQAITTALGPIETQAAGIGDAIGAHLGPWIDRLTAWVAGLDASQVSTFFASFRLPAESGGIGEVFASLGSSLRSLAPAFKEFGAQLPDVGAAVVSIAVAGLPLLTGALGFLSDNVDTIIQFMPLIVAGFLAWRLASTAAAGATTTLRIAELLATPVYFANNVMRLRSAMLERDNALARGLSTAATNAGTAATARSTVGLIAQRAATLATSVATKAAAAGQWLLNAAMTANPIGLVIAAIAALVAALVWFFTQTDLGRQIWSGFMDFLGAAWANISAFFVTVWETVLKPVFDGIGAVFTWLYQNIVIPIVTGIAIYVGIWAAIFTWLWTSVLQPAFAAIGSLFAWIFDAVIVPIVNGIVAYVQLWASILTWLWTVVVQPVLAAVGAAFTWVWENVIRPVVDGIVGALTRVGETVSSVFSGIGEFIGSAFQQALELAKPPLNALIDLVNGAIEGLNAIRVDMPDWLGGESFSLNIPAIPRLAEGGLVSRRPGGILANIGEGRYDEAVVPLSPSVLATLSGGGQAPTAQAPIQVTQQIHGGDGVSAGEVARIAEGRLTYALRGAR